MARTESISIHAHPNNEQEQINLMQMLVGCATQVMLYLTLVCILAIPVCALAVSVPSPIPDTGQTQSYTDTFGEDSDYTINPPSYTKLDAQGNALPDSSASWSMVKDNVTGLIWEGKTNDGSIHDRDNMYNWTDAQCVFIANLNATNYGGFSDWRLPTFKELSAIVNSGTYHPCINTAFFSNMSEVIDGYWSSTTTDASATFVWCVKFYGHAIFDPHIFYSSYESDSCYVRAVRGGQPGTLDNLVINDGGTVIDTSTGLMWQQQTAGEMTWEAAISYCEGLSLGGYNDWRLPNRNELQSLVDYTRYIPTSYNPVIDSAVFPDTVSSDYWSSTADAYDASNAWCVNFSNGNVGGNPNSGSHYVRAVRTNKVATSSSGGGGSSSGGGGGCFITIVLRCLTK